MKRHETLNANRLEKAKKPLHQRGYAKGTKTTFDSHLRNFRAFLKDEMPSQDAAERFIANMVEKGRSKAYVILVIGTIAAEFGLDGKALRAYAKDFEYEPQSPEKKGVRAALDGISMLKSDISDKSKATHEKRLRVFLRAILPQKPSLENTAKFLDKMRKEGRSPVYVYTMSVTIAAAFPNLPSKAIRDYGKRLRNEMTKNTSKNTNP